MSNSQKELIDVSRPIFLRCAAGKPAEAFDFIRRGTASREKGLSAKLLIPVTRGQSGAALQFELELTGLDQLDQFRQSGSAPARRRAAFSEKGRQSVELKEGMIAVVPQNMWHQFETPDGVF